MDLARRYKLLGLKIHEFGLNDTSTSQCCQKKRRLLRRPIMLPKAQHVPRMQPHLSYKNHLCQSIHPFLLLYILPQPQVLEIVVIHWGPGNTFPPTTNPYCQPLLFFFCPFFPFISENPSHSPLPSHRAQMLQHGFVGVQEPIHAVLYTRLFLPVQAAR